MPSAWAPDGLVEAFELPAERLVGVQWHPELLWSAEAHARQLMSKFVHRCTMPRKQPTHELPEPDCLV